MPSIQEPSDLNVEETDKLRGCLLAFTTAISVIGATATVEQQERIRAHLGRAADTRLPDLSDGAHAHYRAVLNNILTLIGE
ncbi:MAG: hypothetical protein OXQ28_00555 [Acidobacteriota bacterium]|nr:hypothetical protein [Acidobacteriota bacterium]